MSIPMPVESTPSSLFRPQALAAARSQTLGSVVLIRPVSFTVLTTLAVVLAAAIVTLLAFGSYTERSTVAGQLASDAGLIRVVSSQAGIVMERHVVEGQTVRSGDVLFVISSERASASQGDTQAAISEQVRERESSLRAELEATQALQQSERQSLTAKIPALKGQLVELESQTAGQRERVAIAEASQARFAKLREQYLVSSEQLGQKSAEVLDQQARLAGLQRDELALRESLTAEQTALADLPLKHQKELAGITQRLSAAAQELAESEAKRQLVLRAPADGTATTVLANVGQQVDPAKPLVSIVPKGSVLHAELYAPSRAVGFVKVGDPVLIRYAAFPYQKFGQHRGIVESVARTALPSSDLFAAGAASAGANDTEPLYRITVRLASQSVIAYGRAEALQSGMALEADVLRETRKLYEWVLDPLYSLGGKL
jgi:membrane fusion protein